MADVRGDRSGVRSDDETGSAAATVGGGRPCRNECDSSPGDPHTSDDEARLSPDFYSDWYFEKKDLEGAKFLRGIHEWRRRAGVATRGECGFGKAVDVRKLLPPETFSVKMLRGKKRKVKVVLAISLDALEIEVDRDADPGAAAVPEGLDIPARVDARKIVWCEVVKRKSRHRTVFEIINRAENEPEGGGYRKNYFQSETPTAEKIIERMNGVLEVKGSALREEYLEFLCEKKSKGGMSSIFGFVCG